MQTIHSTEVYANENSGSCFNDVRYESEVPNTGQNFYQQVTTANSLLLPTFLIYFRISFSFEIPTIFIAFHAVKSHIRNVKLSQ